MKCILKVLNYNNVEIVIGIPYGDVIIDMDDGKMAFFNEDDIHDIETKISNWKNFWKHLRGLNRLICLYSKETERLHKVYKL